MKDIVFDEVYNYCSYGDLIDSMETSVLVEKHDNDYQGDSYYLMKKGRLYGILIFGWGSCGGCDALEAAHGNRAEITQLRDDLWESIVWMTKPEIRKYVNDKDIKLEWWGYSSEGPAFWKKVKDYFN
jgi:hypothetical protein